MVTRDVENRSDGIIHLGYRRADGSRIRLVTSGLLYVSRVYLNRPSGEETAAGEERIERDFPKYNQ